MVANTRGLPVPVENLLRGLPRATYCLLPGKRMVWGHPLYLIGFKTTDGELVIIATQDYPETALEDYKDRWQIETLFACLKSRGFCFESTPLTHPERLEKLFAFLALAFSWAQLTGDWLNERKPLTLKKHGRLAKSLFRYGLDYLRWCLFHTEEPSRQQAFQEILERLFKKLSRTPQLCLQSPWHSQG